VKININRSWSRSHEKKSFGVGATPMKTQSSGAGAGVTFMKRRAPELCHFYVGFTVLVKQPATTTTPTTTAALNLRDHHSWSRQIKSYIGRKQ